MSPKRAPARNRAAVSPPAVDSRTLTIVVAGDATIDWLIQTGVKWPRVAAARVDSDSPEKKQSSRRQSWRVEPGSLIDVRGGGALLLAREIALAAGTASPGSRVISYDVGDLRNIPSTQILHSVVELGHFSERESGMRPVIRVARHQGYSGPVSAQLRQLTIPADVDDADTVVLYDSDNGFREESDAWPLAIRTKGRKPLVVLETARPLAPSPLFDLLRQSHAERLVLVVGADELRAAGVSVSRRLSWERTARDLVWQMQHNSDLRPIAALPDVVIRFGVEGAIHYTGGHRPGARLYYDPALAEDGFRERCGGEMIGVTAAFTAALTARILREGKTGIGEGIRDGIRSSRRFIRAGFGMHAQNPDYAGAEVFSAPTSDDDVIADAAIPSSPAADSADPDFWCLLDELDEGGLEPLSHKVLIAGDQGSMRNVPIGRFGALRTVDRAEIESFRSIQNLIAQYLDRRETRRPLSLAVFGPPGSGKSFGVEQVAHNVAQRTGAKVEKLEFNLAQFESTQNLAAAFHSVRDEVVRGRVPLVFFDEFDCQFETQLGWLRYFLAPMQDGAFRDDHGMHPIGKAIFVFAGGLSGTFAGFSRSVLDDSLTEIERQQELRRFREAKGPDFVSRLRGYVNVRGPNPDPAKPGARSYLLRRAMIARSLFERNWSALRDQVDPHRLSISEAVVRALIGVPEYKHGVRSLEAVLDMSMLEGRTSFDPAALPAPEQLEQHVDAQAFARLVLQGVLFAAAREAIAEAIHEKYRTDRAADKSPDSPVLLPWSGLAESYKRSNREQADDLIRKLERVDCGYRPVTTGAHGALRFSSKEVELLAELEHERWMKEKLDSGYSYGPERDDERRTHPDLVSWSVLPEKRRQYDRDTVTAIPEFMARAKFEVYRL